MIEVRTYPVQASFRVTCAKTRHDESLQLDPARGGDGGRCGGRSRIWRIQYPRLQRGGISCVQGLSKQGTRDMTDSVDSVRLRPLSGGGKVRSSGVSVRSFKAVKTRAWVSREREKEGGGNMRWDEMLRTGWIGYKRRAMRENEETHRKDGDSQCQIKR